MTNYMFYYNFWGFIPLMHHVLVCGIWVLPAALLEGQCGQWWEKHLTQVLWETSGLYVVGGECGIMGATEILLDVF